MFAIVRLLRAAPCAFRTLLRAAWRCFVLAISVTSSSVVTRLPAHWLAKPPRPDAIPKTFIPQIAKLRLATMRALMYLRPATGREKQIAEARRKATLDRQRMEL